MTIIFEDESNADNKNTRRSQRGYAKFLNIAVALFYSGQKKTV